MKTIIQSIIAATALAILSGCGNQGSTQGSSKGALSGDAAERVYVPPGEYDEFYAFVSGGFSGQLAVYVGMALHLTHPPPQSQKLQFKAKLVPG